MSTHSLSPELALLTAICLSEKKPVVPQAPVDWDKLVRLARRNGVLALVADRFGASFPEGSASVAGEVTRDSVLQAMHNLMAMKKMLDVYRGLCGAGLRVFPMKGPLWGWMYYGNTGLRSFGDLDFFIDENDLRQGIGILRDHGFFLDGYRSFLLEKNRLTRAYVRTDYQLAFAPYESARNVQLIELQWRNTYPRFGNFYSYAELMDRPACYQVSGHTVRVPRPEYQLLMLTVHHGLVEQWGRIKYLSDLVLFLRKEAAALDWDFVWAESSAKGLDRVLLAGLYLVSAFTGDLPVRMPYAFEEIADYPFEAAYRSWEEEASRGLTKSGKILRYNLRHRKGLANRWALLKGHLLYLTEWRLLWHKARWYSRKRDGARPD